MTTIDITLPDSASDDLLNQVAFEAVRAVNAQVLRDSDGNPPAPSNTVTAILDVGAPGIDIAIGGVTLDADLEDELSERIGGHLLGELFPIEIS